MVQVYRISRHSDANGMCSKTLLRNSCARMVKWLTSNKSRAGCEREGVFPLGLQLLQLECSHSDKEMQWVLCVQADKDACLLAEVLRKFRIW